MKKPRIRVLLADDHQIVRDGLRLLIDSQTEMQVIGEAADGLQALERALALKPDVVVMDLSMPRLNGLQTTQRLISHSPGLKVIALTAHEDEGYLSQLCQAGAVGYVLKRAAGDELIEAINVVMQGGVHFDASLAAKALARQISGPPQKREVQPANLSEREKEVLIRLAWGYSNKEIAAELHLSVKTVETYKVRVAEKLRLRSRTEMVRYALRNGWLTDEQRPVPK